MKKDHLYLALVFYILGLCILNLLGEILVTLKRNKYIVLEVTSNIESKEHDQQSANR